MEIFPTRPTSFTDWLFHKPSYHLVLILGSTFLFETRLFAWFWSLQEFYWSPKILICCEGSVWFLTYVSYKSATLHYVTGSEPRSQPGQFYLSFRYIYCELVLWEGSRHSPLRACLMFIHWELGIDGRAAWQGERLTVVLIESLSFGVS